MEKQERLNLITLCRCCKESFNGVPSMDEDAGQPLCPGCQGKQIVLLVAQGLIDIYDKAEKLDALETYDRMDFEEICQAAGIEPYTT